MNYDGYFLHALARLRDERRYRVFADLERIAGRYPHAIWHSPAGPRSVVIWCSKDYLGMGQHPKVIGAMLETAARMGTGAGGTRNIAGTKSSAGRARGRVGRPPRQGRGAPVHLRLRVEPDRHFDHRQADAELPDPVRRAQPQLDDRGRAPIGVSEAHLAPQRPRPSRGAAQAGRPRATKADRVRESLF